MKDDDLDLYEMALGHSYAPSTSQPKTEMKEEAPTSSEAPEGPTASVDYAGLFRRLLTGSRSQIEQLKRENERLRNNLENAISSGGVVVCPNCTHPFKDRQHSMRPRAMKKMRARSCVELEFNNPEDLETWLYLNQLETNNDGMPTVMNVKKVTKEKSLKNSGSLIPKLMEKRKNEEQKETFRIPRRSRELNGESENQKARSRDARKSEDVTRRREREDSNDVRRKDPESRKPGERESRRKDPRQPRSEKMESERRGSRRPTEDVKKIETIRSGRVVTRPSESSSTDTSENRGKRKIDDPLEDDPKIKAPRKSLAERINFPNSSKPSESQKTSTEKPPARKTIVWNENDEKEAKKTSSQFQFKIPERRRLTAAPKSVAPPSEEPAKQKFKFVPTAKKNLQDPQAAKEVVEPKIQIPANPETTWKCLRVVQTARVLEHRRKRAQERRDHHSWIWPNGTIVVNEYPKPNRTISEALAKMGVSAEGIETLRKQLKNSNSEGHADHLKTSNSKRMEEKETPSVHLPSSSSNQNASIDEENDVFDEFFPDFASSKKRQKLEKQFSTETIGGVTDREEDELMDVYRAESEVPPTWEYLEVRGEDVTVVKTEDADWQEFCLEDVEDDVDDSVRERRLSEMDKEEEEKEEETRSIEDQDQDEMDWLENIEEPYKEDDEEVEPIDMKCDFRLSDEEDLISPMTSTPKKASSTLGESNIKEDSFLNELDWNYGTEDEGEEEDEEEETIRQNLEDVEENVDLEEGELSEEGEEKDEEDDVEKESENRKEPRRDDRGRRDDRRDDKRSSHRDDSRHRRLLRYERSGSHRRHPNSGGKRDLRPATYLRSRNQ